MDNFLSLRRLSVGYPDRVVLQNIDLEIVRGEILSVIGPNGAGKSTLLKSISGQLPLLGGSVVMQGEDLAGCSAMERARKMALVLTEHIRPEYMTCREVVSAGRYPYTGRMGVLQPRDKEIVEALGAQFGSKNDPFQNKEYFRTYREDEELNKALHSRQIKAPVSGPSIKEH